MACGEHVAPITIDMALTQKMIAMLARSVTRDCNKIPSEPVDWPAYERFLDDCVEIGHKPGHGVKAISLVSDGESTENPFFIRFIRKAKANGIDIASGTNGLKLKPNDFETIVDNLTYLRININAARPEPYAEIMGTSSKKLFHSHRKY